MKGNWSTTILDSSSIALVIPAYKAQSKILEVLSRVPNYVNHVVLVDDACPQKTGDFALENWKDPRLRVLVNSENLGVGGAMKRGYLEAQKLKCDVIVKVDADNQMDQSLIPSLVLPILSGKCDFSKGNRFVSPRSIAKMPRIRIFGNLVLSFMSKFSSGYWDIFDPTNGFTAINTRALSRIELEKVDDGYFFESDMLFRLGIARAVVQDVPMIAIYDDEISNLKISRVLFDFTSHHLSNSAKRIGYSYFVRDFNFASISLLAGSTLTLLSLAIGAYSWTHSFLNQIQTPIGTQFLFLTMFIAGFYSLVNFLNFDIYMTPRTPISSYDD